MHQKSITSHPQKYLNDSICTAYPIAAFSSTSNKQIKRKSISNVKHVFLICAKALQTV